MSTVFLCKDNWLSPDEVSNTYVSSEQAAFPASNIYLAQRRSKVWRSDGYWVITASNNTLVFRETLGTDLTATLTVGEYNSTADLLEEIKTQMDAEGASTYTMSVDTTTGKIKFSSNMAGGGNIFQLIWTSSTGLATLLGFDNETDQTGSSSYLAHILKIHSSEWIKWDLGISSNPNAFMLVGARNKSISISPSATIRIQGNETNVWTNPSYNYLLDYNERAIGVLSSEGLHTEGLRYWRIYIEDYYNPFGYVEIGNLFLGSYFNPLRGSPQFPFTGSYVDRSVTVFSEGGQSFSDIREKTEEFSLEWFGLTVAEKEEIDDFFLIYGTSVPFFVAFDKDAVFSSDSNYYIRYCKFSTPPSYSLIAPGVYNMSMQLREEL